MYRRLGMLLVATSLVAAAAGGRAHASGCGFDLFVLQDGVATDVTNSADSCEFRPEWSPSRQLVAFNYLPAAAPQTLALLDVATGAVTAVPGGENGDNPSWSPNGQLLAFSRQFVGDPNAYVVPPGGGTRTLVAADAYDLDWAPSSQRLSFVRVSDASIRTVALDGTGETIVAPAGTESACFPLGCGVAWSPNGQWIAYSGFDSIWKVRVSPDGLPLAAPELVTPAVGPFYQTQLAWTGDSKAILFNSNSADDGGASLYRVDAAGGTPVRLATPSTFNFDPNVARGGGAIVYAGSTP